MLDDTIDLADYLQRFTSKVLWHFTGYSKDDAKSFDILKVIVKDQNLKKTEHPEDIIMPKGEKRWCFPYSCMCDIPFKDLRIHTGRYGKYGIAFNKENAVKNGHFNPVLYIHRDARLFSHSGELLKKIDELIVPHKELEDKLYEFLGILGAYIKRCDLTAPIDIGNKEIDEQQNNNFYYEREWRSAYDWKFSKDDIEAIMVPKKDLKELKGFIQDKCQNKFDDVPIIPYEMVERL